MNEFDISHINSSHIMRRILTLLAVCLSFAVVSCEKGPKNDGLGLARHEVDVDRHGGSFLISSKANFDFGELHVLTDGGMRPEGGGLICDRNGLTCLKCDWMKASKCVSGTQSCFIHIEVSPNLSGRSRSCRIWVHNGNKEEVITVHQK